APSPGRRKAASRWRSFPTAPNPPTTEEEAMLSVDEIKGVDRDISRRPGYQLYRPVEPWPFTRHPPTQQAGKPAVPRQPTPVFGTSCPPRGLSGIIRTAAYRVPDHLPRKWLLLLLADRVEATGPRLRRLLTYGAPVLLA